MKIPCVSYIQFNYSLFGRWPVAGFCIIYLFTLEMLMKAVQYYEKIADQKQKAYMKMQCHCVLCNTSLELQFEAINQSEIKEVASCPQCEIRTRAKTYVIH